MTDDASLSRHVEALNIADSALFEDHVAALAKAAHNAQTLLIRPGDQVGYCERDSAVRQLSAALKPFEVP